MTQKQQHLLNGDKSTMYGARCTQIRCQEAFHSAITELMRRAEPDFRLLGHSDSARAATRLLRSASSAILFEIVYAESEAAPEHIRKRAIAKRLKYSQHLNAAYLGFCYGQQTDPDCEVMKAAKAWDDERKRRAGERPHEKQIKYQEADRKAMQAEDADLRHAERWVRAAHAYHLIGYSAQIKSTKPIHATPFLIDFLEKAGQDIFDLQARLVTDVLGNEAGGGDTP